MKVVLKLLAATAALYGLFKLIDKVNNEDKCPKCEGKSRWSLQNHGYVCVNPRCEHVDRRYGEIPLLGPS